MAKPTSDTDTGVLRRELEAVIRGWLGKGKLSLESMSLVSSTTARYLRDVEEALGAAAVPAPPPSRPAALPPTKRTVHPRPAEQPSQKERLIGILERAQKEMRISELLAHASKEYPDVKWETGNASSVLGREARRPNPKVIGRRKGKNIWYRYALDDQLPLNGGNA